MGIMIGSNALNNCKIGANQVDKIYLGSTEIWKANNLPNWIPSDWKSHIPSNLATGASYAVFAIKFNKYIDVFKVVARNLQTINCIYATNRYVAIEKPLFDGYSAFARLTYKLNGTFNLVNGVYNFTQYLNTLESVDNSGGYTGDNAVLLETQGGIVWNSGNVIALDDYT